jgi:cytochrome c
VLNVWLVAALWAASPPPQSTLDPGARAFQRCVACHSVQANDHDNPAPNLRGVFGRRVASVSGYPYSNGMRAAGRRGMVWNEATLDRFLADPDGAIPDTDMPYQGGSAAERAAVIAWLRRTN